MCGRQDVEIQKRCAAARDGGWSQWRTGACLSTCGSGVKERTRTCTNPAPNQCGQPCPGPGSDYQQCTGLPSCCGRRTFAVVVVVFSLLLLVFSMTTEMVGVIRRRRRRRRLIIITFV